MNKRGVELGWNVIVLIILALIAIVIIAFVINMFLGHGGDAINALSFF